jgi:hypothetical protein
MKMNFQDHTLHSISEHYAIEIFPGNFVDVLGRISGLQGCFGKSEQLSDLRGPSPTVVDFVIQLLQLAHSVFQPFQQFFFPFIDSLKLMRIERGSILRPQILKKGFSDYSALKRMILAWKYLRPLLNASTRTSYAVWFPSCSTLLTHHLPSKLSARIGSQFRKKVGIFLDMLQFRMSKACSAI